MLKIALKSAEESGKILLKYFCKGIKVHYKGIINPVTIADKKSEEKIVQIIKRNFPTHGIICEETCPNVDEIPKNNSEYWWVIDPLDGTVNYIHGLPQFCVSIGILKGKDPQKAEPILGVIYNPVTSELFYAEKDRGAYLNGRRIYVSKISEFSKSLFVTGFPYYVHEKPHNVIKNLAKFLIKSEGVRRLGSAALDMAYVAKGIFDGFWEEGLNPWDVTAGAVIICEAGGKVTDYYGGKDFIFGKTLVATNRKLHNKVIKLLSQI